MSGFQADVLQGHIYSYWPKAASHRVHIKVTDPREPSIDGSESCSAIAEGGDLFR